MSEGQMSELLKLIDEKIVPETVKVPKLEKNVTELRTMVEDLRNSVKSSKAEAKPNEQEGRRITAPEVALEHYGKCEKCKPKLDKWLTDNGWEKYEPEPERKRGLGF